MMIREVAGGGGGDRRRARPKFIISMQRCCKELAPLTATLKSYFVN